MQHDDLNDILMNRAAPPHARAGLAEDIIHAALMKPRAKQQGLSFWNELIAMFAIPHPSVAVATGIVLGLAMGLQLSDGLSMLQQDWSSFLDISEGVWL